MLLETLDILENDVVIFSENKLDLKNNFKVIFKSNKVKKSECIDYFEVCKFLIDPVPKNLIVYRLLTNVGDLDAFTTNYGYFLKTSGSMELIYFDPIFAIQDLSFLKFNLEPYKFRFKIQQVGFTSFSNENDEAIFEEVYSFDLKAPEAKHQNDKIFAKAIFALDDSVIWDADSSRHAEMKSRKLSETSKNEGDALVKAIIKDRTKSFDYNSRNLDKLRDSIKKEWQSGYEAYNQFKIKDADKSKPADSKSKTFGQFINEHKKEKSNIFKETEKNIEDHLNSVVLKFTNDS